jgi:hypothetical protein
MDPCFRSNPLTDAVSSLRFASELLEKAATDPMYWKWEVIAIHNSVQGFMACALSGSDGVAVIKDEHKDRRLIQKYLSDELDELPHMLDFLKLYQRIKDSRYMCQLDGAERFRATNDIDRQMKLLVKYRNTCIHYFLKLSISWCLGALIRMIRASTDVIEFLCFQSENICWIDQEGLEQKAREALSQIRKRLEFIETQLSNLQPGTK